MTPQQATEIATRITSPVYGDPHAPMWDLVLAVDEAANTRPLSWARRNVYLRHHRATTTHPPEAA